MIYGSFLQFQCGNIFSGRVGFQRAQHTNPPQLAGCSIRSFASRMTVNGKVRFSDSPAIQSLLSHSSNYFSNVLTLFGVFPLPEFTGSQSWFSFMRRQNQSLGRRMSSVPSTAVRTSPTTPAMMRWLSGIFFPHSHDAPYHFPVVTRVFTDSRQGQVFMVWWLLERS